MLRTNKLIWRTTPGNKDLLSRDYETTRVTIHLFEAEPSDLEQLAKAVDGVLGIIAALKLALHAAAVTDPRSTHFWCICERYEPCLVARRRATPELLSKGAEMLAQLMARYAQCLANQNWPAFDITAPGSVNAWSEVYLEPWMTQGTGGAADYFALSAPQVPVEP